MARLTNKIWLAKAKATSTQPFGARCGVYKCVESLGYYPNPSDLGVGRLKRGESYVEGRKRY